MVTSQERRKENTVQSKAAKLPTKWFQAVLWPLLALSILLLVGQIQAYLPAVKANAAEAIKQTEVYVVSNASMPVTETISKTLPVQEEVLVIEPEPVVEEVIPCKDYKEDARNRLYLYEELDIDPLNAKAFTGEELSAKLKALAAVNEDYEWLLQNRSKIPWGVVAATCNYPEMLDFTLDYLDHEVEECAYTADELAQDFPLFLQWDKRWGYLPYGQSCLAASGCAPTCLAMVIVALTKDASITPNVVGDYSMQKGYYIAGSGSTWSLLKKGAEHFGLKATTIAMKEADVVASLTEGKPVICSMRKGYFTAKGHFITLVGVDEDGKIIVNDPNSVYRSEIHWDFNDIRKQAKGMWSYSVKEEIEEAVSEEAEPETEELEVEDGAEEGDSFIAEE